jgi:hypothetical protein
MRRVHDQDAIWARRLFDSVDAVVVVAQHLNPKDAAEFGCIALASCAN